MPHFLWVPYMNLYQTVAEENAATGGFVAGIISALMRNGGALIWISASRTIFPPALRSFGILPVE